MKDKLFDFGERHLYNACPSAFSGDLSTPAIGYRLAAEHIAILISEDQTAIDPLIFPMVFLYRHHLELRFKEFHRFCSQILKSSGDFQDTHNLDRLWICLSPQIKQINPAWWNSNASAVQHVVSEIQNLDPNSFVFRYGISTAKSGRDEPLKSQDHINVADFWEIINPVVCALDDLHHFFYELQLSSG